MKEIENLTRNIETLSYKELKEALNKLTTYDSKEITRLKENAVLRAEYIKELESKSNKTQEDKKLLEIAKDEYFKTSLVLNHYNYMIPTTYTQADWLVYYCHISMPKEQFDTLVTKANEMLTDYMTMHKDVMYKENRKLKLTMEECVEGALNNPIKETLRKYGKELVKLSLERKIIEERYKPEDLKSIIVQTERKRALMSVNKKFITLSQERLNLKKDHDETIMCTTAYWFEQVIYKYCPQDESSKLFTGAKRYYHINIDKMTKRKIISETIKKKTDNKQTISKKETKQKEVVKEIVEKKVEKEIECPLSKTTDELISLSEKYKDFLKQKDELEKQIFSKVKFVYNKLDSNKDGMTKDDFIDFVEDIFDIPSGTINRKLKGL